MKFSVKSIVVALALSLGATAVPSASGAQTFYGGGGVVVVRDHGHRWHRGDRFQGSRHWRRDHRRAYYRDRYYGGPRHYRDRAYYGRRHHYRDRYDFGRRHHRDGGVVIRLR